MTAEPYRQGAPVLYTAGEAAEILRVKKSWLERQAAGRKIPFTVLGGSYRFTAAHLAEIVRLYEQVPARPGEAGRHSVRPQRRTDAGRGDRERPEPLRARPRSGPSRVA